MLGSDNIQTVVIFGAEFNDIEKLYDIDPSKIKIIYEYAMEISTLLQNHQSITDILQWDVEKLKMLGTDDIRRVVSYGAEFNDIEELYHKDPSKIEDFIEKLQKTKCS